MAGTANKNDCILVVNDGYSSLKNFELCHDVFLADKILELETVTIMKQLKVMNRLCSLLVRHEKFYTKKNTD